MGQRSQIYVRGTDAYEKDKTWFIARYYQWNFKERMISRARHSIEWIKVHNDYLSSQLRTLERILDVNFDYHDIVISSDLIEEYARYGEGMSLNDFVFSADNNDGRLFIDVRDNEIKYCFADDDNKWLGDGQKYIDWQRDFLVDEAKEDLGLDEESYNTMLENIKWMQDNATLMTEDELAEYLEADYEEYPKF